MTSGDPTGETLLWRLAWAVWGAAVVAVAGALINLIWRWSR